MLYVNYRNGCKQLLGHIQFNTKYVHFPKNEYNIYKNGHNSTYDLYFFHETCTIGFSIHKASYQSMLKTQFYEISRVVPFLRAGYIIINNIISTYVTVVLRRVVHRVILEHTYSSVVHFC